MMSADTAVQLSALAFPQVSQPFLETPFVPQSLPNEFPSESPSSSKKRKRVSRSKPEKNVKRKLSSPQLTKTPVTQTGPAASPEDDKKRNKLGYHRTSVACGHCRRRKIRCLIPTEDVTGRCTNCIRLKKECNFFPVEQSASHEKRAEPANRPASSKRRRSSPASPPLLPRPGVESVSANPYVFPLSPTATAPPAFAFSSDPHSGLGIFATSKDPELSDSSIYPQHFDPGSGWDAMRFTHATPVSAANHDTLGPDVISAGNMTGSYQHLFNQPHPNLTGTPLENEPQASPEHPSQHHQTEPAWIAHPARSFSYGGPGHTQQNFSPPRPVSGHEERLRRASTLPVVYHGAFGYGGDTTPSLTEEGSWPLSAAGGSYSTPQSYQWPPTWNPPFDHTNNEHYLAGGAKQIYTTAESKPQESSYAYDASWYQDGSEGYTFTNG